DTSTGNLQHHVDKCEPKRTKQTHAMEKFAQGAGYTCDGFQFGLVKWITSASRPFIIVEDQGLTDLFKMLYA
ncbi:hypothetical protein M422DRAFT_180834, partial [Sphaerobolus stellatus SS14]